MSATTDQLFLEAVHASMRDGSDAYMNLRKAIQIAGYQPPKQGFAMSTDELMTRLEYACLLWGAVSWNDVLNNCRRSEVVGFRTACFVVLREGGHTFEYIGRVFGKNHATVLYCIDARGHEADVRKCAACIKRCLVGPIESYTVPKGLLNEHMEHHA